MKTLVLFILFTMLGGSIAHGQQAPVLHEFSSLDEVIAYSEESSLDLIINTIRVSQATAAKKASKLGIVDPVISLPGTFTHFNELPVTLLPAEVFGGSPGESVELRAGVPYTTEFSQNLQVQLFNPSGWADYKLAKINLELSESNGIRTRQILQENLADTYYSIVSLMKQVESTNEILKSADSVLVITQNRFDEGLVSQQDVNNARVNKLNTEKSVKQIEYLLADSYLTLKTLCNIPNDETVLITPTLENNLHTRERPVAEVNKLEIRSQLLNQDYALQNYKKSKSLLLPSLSFFAGNSYQLNNDTFQPLSGNWVNSNYLGLTLTFNLPSSSTLSNVRQSKLEYQIATREVEKVQHASVIDKSRLENNYDEALSELAISGEIRELNADTYEKNINLYSQGLISVDRLLDSYEAMVNAEYAANSAAISLELAHSKILINNKFN